MIGREPELAQLEAFLESHGAVVISGAPGIGKTTLWEAAVDRARGLRILSARVSGAESGLAFAALTDLLENVGTDALDTLPAPQRRGLEVALLGAEPGGTPAERSSTRQARPAGPSLPGRSSPASARDGPQRAATSPRPSAASPSWPRRGWPTRRSRPSSS